MTKGSHLPPIPEKNVSPKGPGDSRQAAQDNRPGGFVPENLAEQDRQGNIKQNTTNDGYQQDR